MKLLENFRTEYTIVSGIELAEIFAGKELKDFLYQSTSVIFPLIEGYSDCIKKPIFSVGNTPLLQQSSKKALLDDVKDDGYVMFVEGDTLFLSGKTPRGTLNGVYGFLQKFCGVRFFSETEIYVEKVETLKFAEDFYLLDNPSFISRTFFTGIGVRNPVMNARWRMGSPYCYAENPDYLGGNYELWDTSSPHTYMDYVPFEKYGEKHPEWFSIPDKRHAWICLTNGVNEDGTLDESMEESVAKTVIDELKRRISTNKKAKYFVVGQTDNDAWCKCPKCQASYKRLYKGYWWENFGIQETIMVFINCIAREIKKWLQETDPDRDACIVSLSYRGTLHPPICKDENGELKPVCPEVVPEDNVRIFYCASGGCQTHHLGDKRCIRAKRTNDDLQGWKLLNAKLMIYDYSTNFNNVLWYYPYLKTLSKKLKTYKEYGVESMFTQALHIEGKNFDTLFQQYLYSRLFWDINLDMEELVNEFFEKYFHKEVAPYVKKYFEIMENAVYNADAETFSNIHSSMYFDDENMLYSEKVFTREVLEKAIAAIEQGMRVANMLPISRAEKNKLHTKLTSILIQAEMMLLAYYSKHYNTTDGRDALRQKLCDDMQKVGIVYFSESTKSVGVLREIEDVEKYLTID